eukprot:TRINITY_DN15179_c0_g1_i1.p1 TRINITY_DN15179_c0_g1~~TRINITY_DN15179_c0_g1_i1.p1  ORF type:complete len:431 (+),score=50.49 TRINITY_DN15179_c0_g1_i1:339-1631(+)
MSKLLSSPHVVLGVTSCAVLAAGWYLYISLSRPEEVDTTKNDEGPGTGSTGSMRSGDNRIPSLVKLVSLFDVKDRADHDVDGEGGSDIRSTAGALDTAIGLSGFTEHQNRLRECGMVEACIPLLRSRNTEVLGRAIWLLSNLALDSSQKDEPSPLCTPTVGGGENENDTRDSSTRTSSADASDALLALGCVLKDTTLPTATHVDCLKLLVNISLFDQNVLFLLHAGVPSIACSFLVGQSSRELVFGALKLLSNMSCHSAESCDEIVSINGHLYCTLLLGPCWNNGDNELCLRVLLTLGNLVTEKERDIGRENRTRLIFKALSAQSGTGGCALAIMWRMLAETDDLCTCVAILDIYIALSEQPDSAFLRALTHSFTPALSRDHLLSTISTLFTTFLPSAGQPQREQHPQQQLMERLERNLFDLRLSIEGDE